MSLFVAGGGATSGRTKLMADRLLLQCIVLCEVSLNSVPSVPRHFRTSTPRARRRCCGWESMLHKWWRSYRILGVRDLAAQRHVCHRAACSLPVTLFHKLPQNWKIVGVDARPSGHRERRQAAHRIAESIGCGPSSTLQSRHQRQARRRSSVLRSCLMLKPCSSRPL